MAARLVLNLRGSRREDIMPTGKSTSEDHYAYEMNPKASNRSMGDRGVIFVSRGPQDLQVEVLSPQDRMQLNQIKPSSNYYRVASREGKWQVV
jgi:hypothetical protein